MVTHTIAYPDHPNCEVLNDLILDPWKGRALCGAWSYLLPTRPMQLGCVCVGCGVASYVDESTMLFSPRTMCDLLNDPSLTKKKVQQGYMWFDMYRCLIFEGFWSWIPILGLQGDDCIPWFAIAEPVKSSHINEIWTNWNTLLVHTNSI